MPLPVAALLMAALAQQPPAYSEPLRPQYHFSPRSNWTNDPNGLVFFDGEYHLFYQYNPFGDTWGHMSWGHAVSPDLIHWQELPVAIPEEDGIMIFTGSTVVDEHNSSGFCTGGKPCLVAIYTGHSKGLQTQNLAYSNDRGRTWTKYAANPVLDLRMADFRDPHVFWSASTHRWIMAVALPNEHKVLFYSSTDLRHWNKQSEFGPAGATGGQWECPTLVELPVEGNPRRTRWVLKIGLNPGGLQGGSGEQYFVGTFDGNKFVNDNPPATTLWTDYGKDCYCGLVFNSLPKTQPPVMLGWMNNWQYAGKVPTRPFRGQMTIPRRLALRQEAGSFRLVQEPIAAIAGLRGEKFSYTGQSAADFNTALRNHGGTSFELQATIALGTAQQIEWRVLAANGTYTSIGYDRATNQLYVDRTHSGNTAFSKDFPGRAGQVMPVVSNTLQLRILVDRSTIEVFGQNGRIAITELTYPPADATGISFEQSGGTIARIAAEVWPLSSAWR